MGNAGSMDQHTDFRGHNMPLKLPMPEPGELEERFAIVLVSSHTKKSRLHLLALCSLHASGSRDGGQLCVGWTPCLSKTPAPLLREKKGTFQQKKEACLLVSEVEINICCLTHFRVRRHFPQSLILIKVKL